MPAPARPFLLHSTAFCYRSPRGCPPLLDLFCYTRPLSATPCCYSPPVLSCTCSTFCATPDHFCYTLPLLRPYAPMPYALSWPTVSAALHHFSCYRLLGGCRGLVDPQPFPLNSTIFWLHLAMLLQPTSFATPCPCDAQPWSTFSTTPHRFCNTLLQQPTSFKLHLFCPVSLDHFCYTRPFLLQVARWMPAPARPFLLHSTLFCYSLPRGCPHLLLDLFCYTRPFLRHPAATAHQF